jgi:hypothetical protein
MAYQRVVELVQDLAGQKDQMVDRVYRGEGIQEALRIAHASDLA